MFLLERAFADCLERLELVQQRFDNALLIGCPDARWRDRVLTEPDGLQAFVAAYPTTDVEALTRLIADTRAERDRGAPPRKSRALFRELKRIVDAT